MTGDTVGARSPRRRALAAGLVGAALAATLLVGGAVLWRSLGVSRSLPTLDEQCDVDLRISGFQGWCVERRHRDEGLLTDERTELHITARFDGAPSDRYTVVPYPFPDAWTPLEVSFGAHGVVVRDRASGAEVSYPESLYALT